MRDRSDKRLRGLESDCVSGRPIIVGNYPVRWGTQSQG